MAGRATRPLLVVALALAAGCGGSEEPGAQTPPTADAEGMAPEPDHAEEPLWGYGGDAGPEQWAELDPEYAACAVGQEQSPVDLSTRTARGGDAEAVPVTYDYEPATFELVDLGHTFQASAESAGGITVDGVPYDLVQFHAHSPSEHAFDGERADVEVHLVHRNADSQLAVVGVLVEPGQSPSAADRSVPWGVLPDEGETVTLEAFDPSVLLPPDDRTTFRYDGSLTTPPCTEDVQWLVMEQIVLAEPDTVDSLADGLEDTARPLQPLGERAVVLAGG